MDVHRDVITSWISQHVIVSDTGIFKRDNFVIQQVLVMVVVSDKIIRAGCFGIVNDGSLNSVRLTLEKDDIFFRIQFNFIQDKISRIRFGYGI